MDFDYKIFGNVRENANASAFIYHNINKSEIFLHPAKCRKCKGFYDNIEEQIIEGLNHEVQESIVLDILARDIGKYENKWFDETCGKKDYTEYQHSCKGLRGYFMPYSMTIYNSGYFR